MAIGSVSDFDSAMDYASWALETGLWNGREINPEGLNDFKDELIANIAERLFSQDEESFAFQKMASELAYIGSWEEDWEECEEELAALQVLQNGAVLPAGFCKSIKKFWKKHKVEILIGIAVVAVVTAVAVGVLCTGVAAGAMALDAATEKKDPPKPAQPTAKREEPSPTNDQTVALTETPLWLQTDLSVDKDGVILNGERFSFENALNTQILASSIQSYGDAYFWKAYESFMSLEPEVFIPRLENVPNVFANYLGALNFPEGMDTGSHFTDTYASSIIHGSLANRSDIPPPIQEIRLIGRKNQGTVHFHCGIHNNESTVIQGGMRLWESLDKNFAVHPHLIHSDSLGHGLAMVHLEKLDNPQVTPESLWPITAINPYVEPVVLATEAMKKSLVQRSIDYEVSMLRKIADNILEKGNDKLKQAHVAFSNGGHVFNEALKQLSPEQQQTIVVITAGSTVIIDEHLACKVYNVIGTEDWPSSVCNGTRIGIEKAMKSANIEIIPQTETQAIIKGHYFLQPEYQDKIRNIFKAKITDEYEIY